LKFYETPLAGAYLVELERIEDSRGFFARSFCTSEFAALGLDIAIIQCNVSFNRKAGTLRGMHFQAVPHEEAKLVRCTMGSLYDVIIDLRAQSPTFRQWYGAELSAKDHRMLYIPKGFAHGFQTLEDDTEVFYHMSEPYKAESARGVRFDDSAFGIRWPIPNPILSDRDRSYPLLDTVTQ